MRKGYRIGKENTKSREGQNLTFETKIERLARKTICFSKTPLIYDTVIGLLVINAYSGLILMNNRSLKTLLICPAKIGPFSLPLSSSFFLHPNNYPPA
jgi:hypothetical protein